MYNSLWFVLGKPAARANGAGPRWDVHPCPGGERQANDDFAELDRANTGDILMVVEWSVSYGFIVRRDNYGGRSKYLSDRITPTAEYAAVVDYILTEYIAPMMVDCIPWTTTEGGAR